MTVMVKNLLDEKREKFVRQELLRLPVYLIKLLARDQATEHGA